jgi:SAM-dependent methyltransferase
VTFRDHFSDRASEYARRRPDYPPALFAALAQLAPGRGLAWDAGTGNGQAARGLAGYFHRVLATDASRSQLAQALAHERVAYVQAAEDGSGLLDGSVDLVTVAQAAHWFDLDRFYAEVARVLRPGGVLALWGYGLCQIAPAIDSIVQSFYEQVVGQWWPPERRHVEERYRLLGFPLPETPFPAVTMVHSWTLTEFLGYVGTWSAVSGYRKGRGEDPVPALGDQLRRVWDDPKKSRDVRWALFGRIGRNPDASTHARALR